MKKRALKSLSLNKKSIAKFELSVVGGVPGTTTSQNCSAAFICKLPVPSHTTTLQPMEPVEENHATIFWC